MLALILMHVSAYLVCFCHVCRIGWRVASPVKLQQRRVEKARCQGVVRYDDDGEMPMVAPGSVAV